MPKLKKNVIKNAGMQETSAEESFTGACSSIISAVISVFILALVTVFPLIYHDSYVDILDVKYRCYYLCIIGMMVAVALIAIIMAVIDGKRFGGKHVKEWFASLLPANWKRTFRIPDAAVLLFWIAAGISTLQSDYLYEAFWGNEGRYTGLFLLTLYVCSYFLISRCWKVKGWCLQLFLVSGMIMCIIGITDYFQLDVLDFRGEVLPEESTIFTSTVGNINTYTAYVGLIMGFAAAMFMTETKLWKMIWYYGCMTVSFFAIIMGCSDNAYLGLAALFGLSPFILFREMEGVKRYLIMLATLFTSIQCIDWLNQAYSDMVIGLDSLFRLIAGFKGLLLIVILLWAGVLLVAHLKRKQTVDEQTWGKRLVFIWGGVVGLAVIAVCAMFFDANVAGHADRYHAMANYLVFDDAWGTYRGYIWKASLKLFRDFPVVRKLFGFGPDTFGILTLTEIHIDMVQKTGFVFDNAHNEYLQYLVTIGMVGLASYLTFLISAFYSMSKKWKTSPYVAGALGATVCYAAQALVNLNLPIAAPIMWLMLSAGMAGCGRKMEEDGYGKEQNQKQK